MSTTAIIMGIIGFALLYGGLTYCVGIAWYHNKQQTSKKDNDI